MNEEKLREALRALLQRDMLNTCQHENTHRGGAIWEICDDCGAKWADDSGGKPEWKDPPEWIAARAALETPSDERQMCFINCGLPGDQCACYVKMMSQKTIYNPSSM